MIEKMAPMIETSTYLPLFCENGEWIERPDFMVIAALSQTTIIDRQHVYAAMLLEESLNPNQTASGMSDFAKGIEAKKIRGKLAQRIMAGTVVVELARLAASTAKPPTINAARRLAAFNYAIYSEKRTEDTDMRKTEKSFLRAAEKSFRDYKAIVHLLAAAVYDPQLLGSLEGNEEDLRRFLGIARAFEEFIDANVVSKLFKWTPWRVPTRIESLPKLEFFPLQNNNLLLQQTLEGGRGKIPRLPHSRLIGTLGSTLKPFGVPNHEIPHLQRTAGKAGRPWPHDNLPRH